MCRQLLICVHLGWCTNYSTTYKVEGIPQACKLCTVGGGSEDPLDMPTILLMYVYTPCQRLDYGLWNATMEDSHW